MNPYIHRPNRKIYRSIFLSDFHIGAKAFDAPALLDFLKSTDSRYLYLVGDIIDGWKLNKRWHWTETITEIFDELVRKKLEGTEIFYLPGNHDEAIRTLPFLRRFRFTERLGVTIKNRMVHTTADNRRFLILHGDQFDRTLMKGRLSKWSDRIYDRFLDLINAHQHMTIIVDGKERRFSLAKYLSKKGQHALHMLNNFENRVISEMKESFVDGLICGHTHIPALKRLGKYTYANCGSWLRTGHTALAEDEDGQLELLDWPAPPRDTQTPLLPFASLPEIVTMKPGPKACREVSLSLINSIRRTWRSKADLPLEEPSRFYITKMRPVSLFPALNQAAFFLPR